MKFSKAFVSSGVIAFLSGIFCDLSFADNYYPAQQHASSTQGYKIALVIGLVFAIWGLYRSKKERIVVFANLTDVLVTLAIPVIGIILHILCLFMEIRGRLEFFIIFLPTACVFLMVYKATRAYNRSIGAGIGAFLHALFTKIFIVGLYLLVLAAIVFYGGGGRRKYEHQNTYARRSRRQIAAGIGMSSLVFALLAFIGLWESNFVSLAEYQEGLWGDEESEEEACEQSS